MFYIIPSMFSENQDVKLKFKNGICVCKFVNVWKTIQDIPKEPIFQRVSHKGNYIILWRQCKWKHFYQIIRSWKRTYLQLYTSNKIYTATCRQQNYIPKVSTYTYACLCVAIYKLMVAQVVLVLRNLSSDIEVIRYAGSIWVGKICWN